MTKHCEENGALFSFKGEEVLKALGRLCDRRFGGFQPISLDTEVYPELLRHVFIDTRAYAHTGRWEV